MSRKKIKGIVVRKHLDTSTFSKSKGGCRWSLVVAIRGIKKYYPIEPSLYMDPQYWKSQTDPATGKETREKTIVHGKGNPDSRAMERIIASKEDEMWRLMTAIMEKGDLPDHSSLWRQWCKTGVATLSDCFKRFVEVREGSWRGGLKGSTAKVSKFRFSYIEKFAKDAPVTAIDGEWVRRLHNWLLKEVQRPNSTSPRFGLAPNTCNSILMLLGAVLNLACEEGHIKENAMATYKKSKSAISMRMQPGKANPFTEEEVELLQEVWNSGKLQGSMRATLQQALISIYSGFRVSDLAQLADPSKFTRIGNHLQIVSVKTGRQLKILVSRRLAAVLLEQSSGSLLLEPILRCDHQSDRLRKLLKVLHLERGMMIWHDLRKTFVNVMYSYTGDLPAISKAIGHSSITVTQGHYLKDSNDEVDRVMATWDRLGIKTETVNGIEVLNEVAAMVAANPVIRVTPKMAELLRKHCGMEVGGLLKVV